MIALLAILAAGQAQLPPFIEFRVPKAPTVAVADSGGYLSYELHVTNLTANPFTLRKVEVLDSADRVLLALEDSALLRAWTRAGPPIPAAERLTLAGGLRGTVFLWVPVSRLSPPSLLRHRLLFGRDSSTVTLAGAPTPVNRDIAVIVPPLRGEWAALNGPSNASGHRRTTMTLNGVTTVPQRFGIDYLQVDSAGRSFRGDRSRNENFYAQGQEAYAVANGTVVATRDSIPENVPGGRAVPINLETVGGNYIVIDIGTGRYAFYAHLQPGSLRFKVGDRVRQGQVIGLVGNSGNSTEPHLHFHITDALAPGTTTLGAEGIPYAFERMEIVGQCTLTTSIECRRHAPMLVRGALPRQNQLVRFGPPARSVPRARR